MDTPKNPLKEFGIVLEQQKPSQGYPREGFSIFVLSLAQVIFGFNKHGFRELKFAL